MKERAKDNKVWENNEDKIEVWIEEEFGQERVVFSRKNSNMAQGITLEEAESIKNAMLYFQNID
jgi:hypothetical protein